MQPTCGETVSSEKEQIPVHRKVHQDQMRRRLADLSGTIVRTPMTEELLVETPEEANVARAAGRRWRRTMEELRWKEAAFQECQENLLDKWCMVPAGHDGSVSSYHSEEPERSAPCIPVKGLETNSQLTTRKLFRGKVQHSSNHSRGKNFAHDHQTFRESYCCQQDLQSNLNLRLSVFTDEGQGNGECDRGDDQTRAIVFEQSSRPMTGARCSGIALNFLTLSNTPGRNRKPIAPCPTWHTTHLSDFNFCWCSTQEEFIISVPNVT